MRREVYRAALDVTQREVNRWIYIIFTFPLRRRDDEAQEDPKEINIVMLI